MRKLNYFKNTGFTLVEMAIVLVIIGLILGGVLKGQELVIQARVKSMINDFNQVTAAYYTYFDRYHRFPGDDPTADDRWSAVTCCSGTACGDGTLGTAGSGYDTGTENKCLWRHLRNAGIINGDVTSDDLPTNPVGGVTGIQDGGAFDGDLSGDAVICTDGVSPKLAELMDYAIDDGDSDAGVVMSGTAIGTAAVAAAYTGTANLIVCRIL